MYINLYIYKYIHVPSFWLVAVQKRSLLLQCHVPTVESCRLFSTSARYQSECNLSTGNS